MEMTNHQFAEALKRLGGDEELFHDLATYFIEDTPDLLQTIHDGLVMSAPSKVERAAHTLRGLAANFDAKEAMTLAGSIEQLAGKGEWQAVPAALARLESEVRCLRNVLSEFLSPSA